MKTTIDLPDPLFRRVKATAASEGMSLKAFITRAVESKLDATPSDWQQVLANLPRVPAKTIETVQRNVAEADAQDLAFQTTSIPVER